MSGENLLSRALSLSDELSQISTDELKQYSGHIARLSRFYCRLEHDLTNRDSRHATGDCTSAAHTAVDAKGRKASRHRQDLKNVLSCSLQNLSSIREAVGKFRQPTENDACLTARTVHLQSIPTLRKRRFSIAAASPERILILCACASLAKDFYQFELQGGWQPKQTSIMESIREKQDIAVQRMGKNVHRYTASKSTVLPSVQQKLDAALRVGIKLAIVGDIGNGLGVPCLSLLLGFAFDKISRLSFSSLKYLQEEVQAEPAIFQAVWEFGTVLSAWWSTCQEEYHARFRDSTADTPKLWTATPSSWPNSSTLPLTGTLGDFGYSSERQDALAGNDPMSLTCPFPIQQGNWDYGWSAGEMSELHDLLS